VSALTVTSAPGDVPTTPSGIPTVDMRHVGLEHQVEMVTTALCALATGLLSTADEDDFPDASRMAQDAHTLTYALRQHVIGRRVKAMKHRRTGSPS
jgi:hypothetical protein